MLHSPLCRFQVKSRRRFICNNQLRLFDHRSGYHHSSGHSSGKLKGILFLNFFCQTVPSEDPVQLLFSFRILFAFADLRSHLHQRIQVGSALRNHNNLFSSESADSFFCKRLSTVKNLSAHFCIIGKNPHYPMSQKAFSGTGRTHNSHHFSLMDSKTEISDHRKLCLLCALLILGKGNIHISDFKYCIFFHFTPPIHERWQDPPASGYPRPQYKNTQLSEPASVPGTEPATTFR